jgi:hypothetical protein
MDASSKRHIFHRVTKSSRGYKIPYRSFRDTYFRDKTPVIEGPGMWLFWQEACQFFSGSLGRGF